MPWQTSFPMTETREFPLPKALQSMLFVLRNPTPSSSPSTCESIIFLQTFPAFCNIAEELPEKDDPKRRRNAASISFSFSTCRRTARHASSSLRHAHSNVRHAKAACLLSSKAMVCSSSWIHLSTSSSISAYLDDVSRLLVPLFEVLVTNAARRRSASAAASNADNVSSTQPSLATANASVVKSCKNTCFDSGNAPGRTMFFPPESFEAISKDVLA
mmetsp:Transcript_39717/g.83497  ORF Transcript_39717/g.83497 Transcript_39717/m.83497 type:complete len:216 (-) Transcript_39717:1282-1929(-)